MQKAFSLIELAIVILVITALMSVIILAGDLVQSAKVGAMMQQLSGYNSSVNRFYDKYKALPGDMDFAYDIWGSDCETVQADCNGNGDRIIGEKTTGVRERYMVWRHLYLSDFLSQSYDGEQTNVAGTSVPYGKYPDSRISFPSIYDGDGTSTGTGHNSLYVVADDSACDTREIFSSQQMYQIDVKFDDGRPTGLISANENTSCTPNSSGCEDGSNYLNITDGKTVSCWMYYATSQSWVN
jgi:type II secretory pathway pseudopilin PulG